MLKPEELFTKTRERVMEVLRTKHLVTLPPSVASLDSYPKRPLEIVSVNITEDTVMYVGRRLSIRAGTGGGWTQ